jgi:hypothetical protein
MERFGQELDNLCHPGEFIKLFPIMSDDHHFGNAT